MAVSVYLPVTSFSHLLHFPVKLYISDTQVATVQKDLEDQTVSSKMIMAMVLELPLLSRFYLWVAAWLVPSSCSESDDVKR